MVKKELLADSDAAAVIALLMQHQKCLIGVDLREFTLGLAGTLMTIPMRCYVSPTSDWPETARRIVVTPSSVCLDKNKGK